MTDYFDRLMPEDLQGRVDPYALADHQAEQADRDNDAAAADTVVILHGPQMLASRMTLGQLRDVLLTTTASPELRKACVFAFENEVYQAAVRDIASKIGKTPRVLR